MELETSRKVGGFTALYLHHKFGGLDNINTKLSGSSLLFICIKNFYTILSNTIFIVENFNCREGVSNFRSENL